MATVTRYRTRRIVSRPVVRSTVRVRVTTTRIRSIRIRRTR